MSEAAQYSDAVGQIRIVLSKLKSGHPTFGEIVAPRDEVFAVLPQNLWVAKAAKRGKEAASPRQDR